VGVRRVLAIVGPEGGFSADEAGLAGAAGARLVSLGTRILRSETAGLALLAILEYASGT
jgi:16S rRNA (uracil1498-N3)-methyltransferase